MRCPICSVKSGKKQLRSVYASVIAAVDNEGEQRLHERCLKEEKEKNECIEANKNLKDQIENLKMELILANERLKGMPEFRIHRTRKDTIELEFDACASIVEYDNTNNLVLVTYRSKTKVGVQKFGCEGFSNIELLDLGESETFIRSMVMSPSGGLCLVSAGNTVYLIDMYNGVVISTCKVSNRLSSLCLDKADRSAFYCGDDKGFLYYVDFSSSDEPKKVLKIANVSIHSICKRGLSVFVSTVYQTYEILFSGDDVVYPLEVEPYSICTNMSAHNGNFLFTLRDANLNIRHSIYGAREMHLRIGAKQVRRHRDRMYGDYVYFVDDERRSLRVFSLQSLSPVYSYTFKEDVVDFFVKEAFLIVLTKKSVHTFTT